MSVKGDSPPPKRMKVQSQDLAKNIVKNEGLDHEENDTQRKMVDSPRYQSDNSDDEDGKPSQSEYEQVTAEELQRLREFQVLDEVNEEDSGEDDSDDSVKTEEELPDDEIDKMLEENLPEGFKGAPKPKEKAYYSRQKIVLEEKGINHFEVLPLDWVMVRHASGMPVYVHRTLRVCTLSKPYFLGKGNTRNHDIPIGAIPCLAYRKALEEEEKQNEIDRSIAEQIENGTWAARPERDELGGTAEPGDDDIGPGRSATEASDATRTDESAGGAGEASSSSTAADLARKPVVLPGGQVMPPPRVETVSTSWKTQHLSPENLNDYCKKLFKFKTVNILHFKRWADRRKYVKARKTLQYPTLPEGTKLITIPAHAGKGPDGNGRCAKRDWVMNMNGCSYLSVFHEYVRRALHQQPVYEFKQLENAATPYRATVYIGGMQYGVGHGSSKRQAKSAAARASIHILIPEMKDDLDAHARRPRGDPSEPEPDFTFFDCVGIEDPRIQEFCAATSEPSPHSILRTCLLRNFGSGDRHIHTEMKKLEYQKIELTMKVGKHSATVVCKNKKQAKQRASQAILQALHPHIRSWGSLLRLYGSRSVKSCKEKKLEEQQITLLQDKAQQNEPNHAVLEKLRREMRKLRERDAAVAPIGTLLVADHLPSHSGSMLNNVDL